MSWSCSGGTGTPLTDLSLWICWKVCLCDSRFFKISCDVANKQKRKFAAHIRCDCKQQLPAVPPPHLVLLQLPVQHVGRLLVSVLEGDVLPQSHLCSVEPGSDDSERTGQRLVQMDVPVQQLQTTAI